MKRIKFEDLNCDTCVYMRVHTGITAEKRFKGCHVNSKVITVTGLGCGDGRWVIKRHDGRMDTLCWIDYWYEYDDPDNLRNKETGKYDVECPKEWQDCEIVDWRTL